MKTINNTIYNDLAKEKQANISRVPPPILPRPSKSILAKSKFFIKNSTLDSNQLLNSNNKTCIQASKKNMNDIIKTKNTFPKLLAKKIVEIHDMVNNKKKKNKLRINMTIKSSSKKQVIILISTNNLEAIISQANMHIININYLLKDVKSKISSTPITKE